MIENIDYMLETLEDSYVKDPQTDFDWAVRMLTGDFPETVLMFKNLIANPDPNDPDEFVINFDFAIKESPDSELTEQNEGLQKAAGDVLYKLITESVRAQEEAKQVGQSSTDNS